MTRTAQSCYGRDMKAPIEADDYTWITPQPVRKRDNRRCPECRGELVKVDDEWACMECTYVGAYDAHDPREETETP